MVKKMLMMSVLLTVYLHAGAQTMEAYTLFDSKGKKVSWKKLMKETSNSELVFFGEFHNNPISHWLQFELCKSLHEETKINLGAEMIEADNQDELNDFLQGSIDAEDLDSLARLWPNYDTDYAPLVEFAKENGITFVATNIPRRFAHMVYKNGGFSALDSLSVEEKSWVAPLPIQFDANLPQYQKILEMMQDHATPELVQAQAIKDATMAYFIVMNLREQHTFIHLNGAFHSDFHEGILWYVHLQRPEINAITISTVEQEDISSLNEEHIGRADFIICVDKDMTKTY